MTVSAVVPVRSFDGLTRLAHVIDDEARTGLMLRLVEHTISMIHRAGFPVSIVSSDPAVTAWGAAHVEHLVPEPSVGGLDGAALAGVSTAPGPWIVVHADLPALTSKDVAVAARLAGSTTVIAPSRDGGTSLIGSNVGPQSFSYGPGSFRRHLSATRGRATILVRPGLALDLDHPWDLIALGRLGYVFGETAEADSRDL